jgi:hypothetical protein
VVAAALAALLAWLGANGLGRRLRWRRRRRRSAGAGRILVAWAETSELLSWWGCRRRADETFREHAIRAGQQLRGVFGNESAAHRLVALADMASAASYGPDRASASEVDVAVDAADAIQTLLEYAAPRSRRLARWADPRLAWRPAPVDPAPSIGAPVSLGADPS